MTGFTPTERRRLTAEGATIPERINAEILADEPASDTPVVDDWAAVYGDSFDERLAVLGVTRADCRRAAAAEQATTVSPWVDRLDTVVADATARDPEPHGAEVVKTYTPSADHDGASPRPFGPLTAALAAAARDGLPAVPVSEAAVDSFEAAFRSRFEREFLELLCVQFDRARQQHTTPSEMPVTDESAPETEVYENFLAYLFNDGLVDLCLAYPVFGRLLSTRVRQWRNAVVTFARRLDDDRRALTEQFGDCESLGPVTAVQPLTDDSHGDGRVTCRVTFERGVSVVYKPRTVRPEAALGALADDLGADADVPRLRQPTCLVRDGYGWTAMLEPTQPTGESTTRRYYRRFGALCCLAWLTETTDCHADNVVVADESPALVDAETICHPYLDPDNRPYDWGFGRAVDETPLSTATLPYRIQTGRETQARSLVASSAAPTPEVAESTTKTVVRAVATDAMHLEVARTEADAAADAPRVDGEPAGPSEYVDAVVDGFEHTHRAVCARRAAGDTPLIDHLADLPVRFVYRPTKSYRQTLDRLRQPEVLADGARFGVTVDRLAAPAFDGTAGRRPLAVLQAERTALKRLDRPRFTGRSDATVVKHDGVAVYDLANMSGLDRVRARLARADEDRLAEAVAIVRASLSEDTDEPLTGTTSGSETPDVCAGDTCGAAHGATAHQATPWSAAQGAFERVVAAGETPGGGSRVWSRFDQTATAVPTVTDVGVGLFRGQTGLVVLGAALATLDGTGAYRDRTQSLLNPVVTAPPDAVACPATAGYGLVVAGSLLADGRVVSAGVDLAHMTAPAETVALDGGLAGAVAATTGVARRTDNESVRSRVVALGDRLLNRADEWQREEPTFDRGGGGVVYALAHAWSETGCDRFREAAAETVASWTRQPDAATRIGLDAGLPSASFDLSRTDRRGDELRGGTAGRLTLSVAAGDVAAAGELADRLLARVARRGQYELPTAGVRVADPTLRHGYTGVGYALARCVEPGLPCLVLRR